MPKGFRESCSGPAKDVTQEAEALLARETTSFGPYEEEYRAVIRALMEHANAEYHGRQSMIESRAILIDEKHKLEARIESLEAERDIYQEQFAKACRMLQGNPETSDLHIPYAEEIAARVEQKRKERTL
ncbi:MAG TPA: hypothetical protein VGR71_06200 [Nitrospira sp.]|nr:hypothetical protein [Nitrospira sp.]